VVVARVGGTNVLETSGVGSFETQVWSAVTGEAVAQRGQREEFANAEAVTASDGGRWYWVYIGRDRREW